MTYFELGKHKLDERIRECFAAHIAINESVGETLKMVSMKLDVPLATVIDAVTKGKSHKRTRRIGK